MIVLFLMQTFTILYYIVISLKMDFEWYIYNHLRYDHDFYSVTKIKPQINI